MTNFLAAIKLAGILRYREIGRGRGRGKKREREGEKKKRGGGGGGVRPIHSSVIGHSLKS